MDVVRLAVGNMEKRWDIAMQVEQCVHLDGGLVAAELGPGKQREAEVDGGRIERVEAGIEVHAERIPGIQRASDADQVLREVGEDAPVVGLVGVGQRGTRDAASEAEMIALRAQRTETGFDVAKALAVGQLGEGHRQKLLPTGQPAKPSVATMALDRAAKLTVGKKGNQLRKDGAALVHAPSSTPPRIPRNPSAKFKSRQEKMTPNPRTNNQLQEAAGSLVGQQ
jgi:hypothetical protein